MKNAKRWLAILLAVTLLCSNGVSQLGMIVSASELETTEEAQPKEDAVVEQAEETKEDTGKATVEGVTPEEERGESSAQDAETANVPKAAAQEGQNEANVPEAAPATVAPTTVAPTTATPATAVPASEGAGQQGEATAPEVQTYNVKINKSELDGGQIKAWGSDNNKVDVTEYDGNNQYVKEVKEGEEFNFQITLNDGFEIAQVKVNGNAFDPANTEGNVITYKVAGINEEKVIDVTYNKIETPAEEKAAEEPKTEDETKVEEPAAEETAEPEDAGNTKPAKTLSKVIDGTIVTVSAPEGALEDGWSLEVKQVSVKSVKKAIEAAVADADAIEEIKAFDITLLDKDGNEIQPENKVNVSFSGVDIKGDIAEVYHVNDTKKKAEKVSEATTVSNVEFVADHFSIYAVVSSSTATFNTQETAYELEVGQTLNLDSKYKRGKSWSVDKKDIVEIKSSTSDWFKGATATILAKKEGSACVTYNNDQFYINVIKAKGKISFNLNGGSGNQPADINGSVGDVVTLPTGEGIEKENYIFVGWSTSNDANTVTSNGKPSVYPGGSRFELSGKITLYAVWVQNTGTVSGKITIAIRKDGTIPGEPSLNYDPYSYLTPDGGMTVNVLEYINPAQTIFDSAGVKNLQPNFYTYVTEKNKNNAYWDNETQYVVWYVVKYQGNDSTYHIDGVVRDKQKVYLNYDGNGFTEGLVPDSMEIHEGNSVTVSQPGKYYDPKDTSTWQELKKAGYTFDGWNTSADGTGTTYQAGSEIKVTENTTLYAQWKAKGYTVKYNSDGGSAVADKTLKFSEKVDVSPVPTRAGYTFEGWYYNDQKVTDSTYASLVSNDESVQEITLIAKWKEKPGRFGYYLSLENATWAGGMPDNLEVNGTSSLGLPKYAEKIHYMYGDKYNVISNVPVANGYAFIGWLDKERKGQDAAIRSAGEELTYIYQEGDEKQAYTLDALWASIVAKGGTYPYDGTSHQITADIAINEGLNLDEKYVAQAKKLITTGEVYYKEKGTDKWSTDNPSFKDAGMYTVEVKQDITVGGNKVTLQAEATVVINKASVTLKSADLTRKYNGKALVNGETALETETGWAKGEGATYSFTGSQTLVGSSANAFSYTLNEGTNADNYTITKNEGTLTVTNRPEDAKYEITVTANSTTATYDGQPHTAVGLETTTFVVEGNTYTVEGLKTEDPSKTDAGTYTNNITGTAVVKDASGNDVTAQFIVKTTNGSLVINKASVTLKSADLSKVYDGDALVNGETALATETGWAEGEGATYSFTGSQTLVGSSANTFSYTLNSNTKAANYEISKTEGTLIVTNRPEDAKYEITVKANSTTATYDGEEHKAEGVETYEFTVAGHKYKVSGLTTENPKATNAGTYTNNITGTAVVKDAFGNDVTAQFIVKTENGKLVINKASVTLKSADLTRKYNGKALVNGETALETETGWAKGEGATYSFTGSQTLVGSSANAFSYTLNEGTNADNYTITKNEGTLTVTNRPEDAKYEITVTANSTTATYDGQPHTAVGLETTTFVVEGNTYTVEGLKTEDPSKTDAGTYTNNITGTAVVKDADGNVVTDQFVVKTTNGSLTINKADVTLKSADLSKIYDGDALVNGETALATEEGWADSDKASVAYNFTGSQTNVGSSDNTFTVKWNDTVKESNYNVTIEAGTLTVTAQSIDPDNPNYKGITVDAPTDVEYTGEDQTWLPTVTDGNGKALVKDTDYTVTYDNEDRTNVTGIITVTINGAGNYAGTITRTYQITPKPVTITTESKTRAFDGTALTAGGKVEGIVSGETYGFKTTGSQTYVGSSQNTYEMVWADSEVEGTSGTYTAKKTNYTVTESIGTLVVTAGTPENPLDPTLVVNKTHDKSQTYKAGDVITFTITAKNIYEEAKTITLEELEGVALDANVFENVAPGAEVTATATYTVTEQDIVNGTFTNNVTVTFSGVDDKFTGTDTVDELEDANPHMTITKTTVGAEEGHIYKLGEVINYKITATNDGNLTLTNVKVEDALTGNVGENAFTIDTLAPDEAQTFDVRYVVTENDVLAGKVVNNATGTATDPTDPDEPKTPVTPGEKEDPIETPNPSLAVVKTSDKTGVVKLGETITYTITVTNNGNVTINDIEVTDELTGNTGDNAFTIDRLAVGETKQFTATYTVTEDDILEGTIVNRATAIGKDPRNEEVTGDGEVRVDTEEKDSHLTVSKETTSEPENGEKYALGETINYLITVTNDGNLTLTNVKVTDELTGDEWTIDELAPGEEETFDASYTVKESDLGKTVVNVATATGTTPDPDIEKPDVTPGETEDPVEEEKPALAIDKKVVDPKEEYQIGEVVTYEITVTNIGNVTQKNILVEDQMKAAGQARITNIDGANGISNGKQATLDKLVPGAKATITVEYTIVYDDRGNTITNAAVADGEGENPVTPDVPVVIEKVYNINVVHEFAPNNEGDVALLPEDYTIENLKPNTEKSITAEAVKGYVAYPSVQNVTVVDKDITVTFQYYKDVIGTDPTDPEKPDGVSDEFQVVVRFAAVNGTVSTDRAVVTLVDKNGKPAKDGVGHLTKNQIAAATANTGYDQSSLSWTPGEPTITYDITGEMTFTATFTATPAPAPAPTEPTTPPARPTRPTTCTTAPTGNATVENAVTPSEEKVEEKAAEIKEVLKSDDDKVPVANQKLDDLYSGDAKKDNPVI